MRLSELFVGLAVLAFALATAVAYAEPYIHGQ
jgi:hypothetical protein